MANQNDDGRRWATVAIYRACERNHSKQMNRHIIDGCREFLGYGDDHRSVLAAYCTNCGCHRNFHRKEEIPMLVDSTTVRNVHELAVARPQLPQQRLPVPPIPEEHLEDVEEEQEDREPKRERTRFTEAQKEAMRGYADRLGWRLRGHDQNQLLRFCCGIGISVRNFRCWMRNNKRKFYVEAAESSIGSGGL